MSRTGDKHGGHASFIEHVILADEARRESRSREPSTILFPHDLTERERAELTRLMDCADRLETLATADLGNREGSTNPPPRDDSQDLLEERSPPLIHHQFGNYRVIKRIADGGFGSVFLALDEANGRAAAIKIPRSDIVLTDRLLQRFLIEGRAAATLNHPNIVTVYETVAEPVPAIVYEYCDGGTLTHSVARKVRDEGTALRIVLQLAEALQHAHTRGILHRDVKPGNILLVHASDPADENAVEIGGEMWIPKLGDFGLAKVVDDSVHQTRTGVVMGTPQFMAPEQAAGRVSELGTHTDIFSLGAVLYWLLVGQPPFHRETTWQTLQMLESQDPSAPRRLRSDISAKTEAVCLKCLRKPIDARYESAAALADDLRRLLRGEPVSARPPGAGERLGIWGQRHPALAAFSIMFPVVAAAGLLLQWSANRSLQQVVSQLDAANQSLVDTTREAETARANSDRQSRRYAQLFYASDLQLAQRAIESGDVRTYEDALVRHIPSEGATRDLRGPEWQMLWDRGHPPELVIDHFPSAGYCVQLSGDQKYLLACGADSTVRVYETQNWQRLQSIDTAQREVNYAHFSRDGSVIVTAGDDATIAIWDWRSGEERLRFNAHDDNLVYCVQFYDHDRKLVSCGREPVVRLWDAQTGATLGKLLGRGDPHRVEQLDVSDDSRWVATASFDGKRRVWDLESRRPVVSLPAVEDQRVGSVCLFRHGDDEWMLSGTLREGSRSHCSLLLEVVEGEDQRKLPIHFDGIQAVTADRDGNLAAAGDRSGRISMIDINAAIQGARWWYPETIRKSWVGHEGPIYGLAMTADRRSVISIGVDGKVSCWDTNRFSGRTTLTMEEAGIDGSDRTWVHAAVRSDGRVLLLDSNTHLHLWEPKKGRVEAIIDAETGATLQLKYQEDRVRKSFAVHGEMIFGRSGFTPVYGWTLDGNQARKVWSSEIGPKVPSTYALEVSPDGRRLAVCRRGRPVAIVILDTATGEVVQEISVPAEAADGCRALAFDADGRHVAFGYGGNVFVQDLQSKEPTKIGSRNEEIRDVCFVPGTTYLLSGSNDRAVCVWDRQTRQLVYQLVGHRSAIDCVGMHPFGNRIVSTDDLGWVRIWAMREGMLLAEVPPATSQTWHAAVGDRLIGVVDGQALFEQLLP